MTVIRLTANEFADLVGRLQISPEWKSSIAEAGKFDISTAHGKVEYIRDEPSPQSPRETDQMP